MTIKDLKQLISKEATNPAIVAIVSYLEANVTEKKETKTTTKK